LVGVDRRHELSVERDHLESQLRAAEEERRREAEALLQNTIAELIANHRLNKTKADELEQQQKNELKQKQNKLKQQKNELYQLLAEMRPLNFKNTKELSAYIVKHKPGYRYPKISGIVTMADGGTTWPFFGGFSPEIYTIICRELGLTSQGTDARSIHYESFEDINSRNPE